MRSIRRIMFIALVCAAAPMVAPVAQVQAKPAADKKAKPRKPTPVSAEHKKAFAELYAGFKFGMTKEEVIAVFVKQLDESYEERIKATTDMTAQDRLRRDKRIEISRLQSAYTTFEGTKPSAWDVSIVEGEFAHNTGEAMLERWENQGGKNERRFFFFYEGKLWKMFLSLDVSILPEDKKNFATFQAAMEGRYGPGEVEQTRITWRTPEFDARAVDKLRTYDALALVIEDPKIRKEVEATRAAKAPPKQGGNTIIRSVIDPDRKDHPDVKANSNAVDEVIRAQGGPPPKSTP
jgi:hypothetical protein